MEKVGFIEKYVKPWFFSSSCPDRIKPIRVAISVFILLIVSAVIMKFISPERLSDVFVLGLVGNLGILLGADTWRSNSKDQVKK